MRTQCIHKNLSVVEMAEEEYRRWDLRSSTIATFEDKPRWPQATDYGQLLEAGVGKEMGFSPEVSRKEYNPENTLVLFQ